MESVDYIHHSNAENAERAPKGQSSLRPGRESVIRRNRRPDSKIAAKQMIHLAIRTLGLASILFLPLVAVGADYLEGLAAHRRGDYEAALAEWRPLAAQGDAESQYRIARMYYHGEGAKDDAAAANWYRKAADQGHDKAQNNLGLLYEEGRGVEQDIGTQQPRFASSRYLPRT